MCRPSQTPSLDMFSSAHMGSEPTELYRQLRQLSIKISKATAKVVVFQGRFAAPTYATPSEPLHKPKLESSSTGSSFPAGAPKPCLLYTSDAADDLA